VPASSGEAAWPDYNRSSIFIIKTGYDDFDLAVTSAIAGGTILLIICRHTTFTISNTGRHHRPATVLVSGLNMPGWLNLVLSRTDYLRDNERTGAISMNHTTNFTTELDQTDEDVLHEVSDEALEAAAGASAGGQCLVTVGPTVMVGGCC
jgi:hypothetical protein